MFTITRLLNPLVLSRHWASSMLAHKKALLLLWLFNSFRKLNNWNSANAYPLHPQWDLRLQQHSSIEPVFHCGLSLAPCVVLCYAMLCYAMLCYAMLCYAMLCYAMLCYAMLCYAMLCYAMLCYVMLCYVMLCYLPLPRSLAPSLPRSLTPSLPRSLALSPHSLPPSLPHSLPPAIPPSFPPSLTFFGFSSMLAPHHGNYEY